MSYYTPFGTEFEFNMQGFETVRCGICAKIVNDPDENVNGGDTYAPDIQVYWFDNEEALNNWLNDPNTICSPGEILYASEHTDGYDEGIDIMLHDVVVESSLVNGHEYIPSDFWSLRILYENLCDSIRRGTYDEDYAGEESAY